MKIDNKKVDLFYNYIDEACMAYYKDIKMDYLDAFVEFGKTLIEGYENPKLSQRTANKIAKIIDSINKNDFLNEEVRLALELILVKGFKHRNVSLDFLTPDAINYLIYYICEKIANNHSDDIVILDTVLGTGNLIQTVINNLTKEVQAIGIELDAGLANIAKAFNDFTDNDLVININNAKNRINTLASIVIGDFGESSDVYDIILNRLDNIKKDGYFIYVINNDFFSKAPKGFKEILSSQATLLGLILLPYDFVQEGHVGKSIIIGKNEVLLDYQMAIITIDDLKNAESVKEEIKKIDKMFE